MSLTKTIPFNHYFPTDLVLNFWFCENASNIPDWHNFCRILRTLTCEFCCVYHVSMFKFYLVPKTVYCKLIAQIAVKWKDRRFVEASLTQERLNL